MFAAHTNLKKNVQTIDDDMFIIAFHGLKFYAIAIFFLFKFNCEIEKHDKLVSTTVQTFPEKIK